MGAEARGWVGGAKGWAGEVRGWEGEEKGMGVEARGSAEEGVEGAVRGGAEGRGGGGDNFGGWGRGGGGDGLNLQDKQPQREPPSAQAVIVVCDSCEPCPWRHAAGRKGRHAWSRVQGGGLGGFRRPPTWLARGGAP